MIRNFYFDKEGEYYLLMTAKENVKISRHDLNEQFLIYGIRKSIPLADLTPIDFGLFLIEYANKFDNATP